MPGGMQSRDHPLAWRPDHFVIELASNDGYLLRNFVEGEMPCLGFEPAANIAKVAQERGVNTLGEFLR